MHLPSEAGNLIYFKVEPEEHSENTQPDFLSFLTVEKFASLVLLHSSTSYVMKRFRMKLPQPRFCFQLLLRFL